MSPSSANPWLRWIGRIAATAFLLPCLLALIWVIKQWGDDAPTPLPPELALPAPRLKPEQNLAYELEGLMAPLGEDPREVAMRQWQAALSPASAPKPPRASASGAGQAELPSLGNLPYLPSSAKARACQDELGACESLWWRDSALLAPALRQHHTLATRCESVTTKLLASRKHDEWAFEERLPTNFTASELMRFSPMFECMRWLRMQAVLAAKEPSSPAALQSWLERGFALQEAVRLGARSSAGQMMAISLTGTWLQTLNFIALRTPSGANVASAWAPVLRDVPDTRPAAVQWLITETHFQRSAIDEWSRSCEGSVAKGEGQEDAFMARLGNAMGSWVCRNRIAYHPEREKALLAKTNLKLLTTIKSKAWPAILEQQTLARFEQERKAQELSHWKAIQVLWQHGPRHELFGTGGQSPLLSEYLARQADAELLRQASAWALASVGQVSSPSRRAAWMQEQAKAYSAASWRGTGLALNTTASSAASPIAPVEQLGLKTHLESYYSALSEHRKSIQRASQPVDAGVSPNERALIKRQGISFNFSPAPGALP